MYDELMPVKVKTGDNTNITLYTSLLIISVVVVSGTIVLRKKKS